MTVRRASWLLCLSLWLLATTGSPAAAEWSLLVGEPLAVAVETTPDEELLNRRIAQEERSNRSRFAILPHKTNYLLPLSYHTPTQNSLYVDPSGKSENLDNLEVKFQLSIKTPIWENLFGGRGALYAAYSQLALWQAYNNGMSAPFREINFEPELFLAVKTDRRILGIPSRLVSLGINHQSNGRTEPYSRSWNRLVANLVFGSGKTYVTVRPWLRLPESTASDDNPHIERYLGYGELQFLKQLGREQTLVVMVRNNLRGDGNKGAVQLDWSFPLRSTKLKGYVQYFNGYGESLIDYNHANNRIGVGVMLTDWL